jgi:hypothetical protein
MVGLNGFLWHGDIKTLHKTKAFMKAPTTLPTTQESLGDAAAISESRPSNPLW